MLQNNDQKLNDDDDVKNELHYQLISAAMRGDVQETAELLNNPNMNANGSDDKGNSALHWAAYFDEPEVLQILINSPKVNLNHVSKRGNNVLHMAAIANAGNSLKLLLYLGTKEAELLFNQQNKWGETALHHAAATGKCKAVELLCKANVDTTIKDNWGRTALRVTYENLEHAAKDILMQYCTDQVINDAENVQQSRIKLDNNADPNQQLQNIPIRKNNKKMMDEFINEMKNVQQRITQNLALDKVKVKHPFNMVGKVVGNNAVVDDDIGGNPDDVAVVAAVDDNDNNIAGGDVLKQKQYKYRLGSKFEYGVSPKTLQQLEEWLMDDEIDNNGKDLFGWSALHKVIFWQKNEYVLPLLQHMSAPVINSLGPEGEGAIHMALSLVLNGGKKKLLQWLCDCPKIDKAVKNKSGFTALEIAQKHNAANDVIAMLTP